MDWRSRVACRTEEPELFFPVGTSGPALVQTARATAVCRRCPVMLRCRDWAMTTGQAAGVWGGLTEDQRRAAHWQEPLNLPLSRTDLGDAAPPRPSPDHSFNATSGRDCQSGVAPLVGSMMLISLREVTPSFAKTLRRCHSTVCALRNKRAPMSRFVSPSAARRAIRASWR